MRISLILLIALLFFSCKKQDAETTPVVPPPVEPPAAITSVLRPVTENVNSAVGGYYVALPSNYDQTTERYPLLIFITGAGQFGNGSIDLPLLLKDGPAQVVDEKKFPGTFNVNGKQTPMIVFTPQFRVFPTASTIENCLAFVKNKYRIDTFRVYLAGLSIGGILSCDAAALMPSRVAAIVPMAGVSPDFTLTDKCQKIAQHNIPVWAFHSADDPIFPVATAASFIAKIDSLQPSVKPRMTTWPYGGHDAWTRAIDPHYKFEGRNIYEWMLQYHK